MPRIDVSVSAGLHEEIRQACINYGFDTVSGYVRFAIQNQLSSTNGIAAFEEHFAASMTTMRKDTQILHAAMDALVKLFLLSIPEPPADLAGILRRDAIKRHKRFVKNVAYMVAGKRAPQWATNPEEQPLEDQNGSDSAELEEDDDRES